MAVSPLNPLVRTMLTSLHGAMQRGMPVDQAATYVKGMAQQGIAPLIDLPAMLKQFEQLKQPETQSPQTPTIREQIAAMAQAQQGGMPMGAMQGMPQGGMPPQMAGQMPQMPQQPPPMQQGLGALNAGAMENPQGFAGGGIVAFEEGGVPQSAPPKPRTLEELYRDLALAQQQGTVPQFKQAVEDLRLREQEMGIGEYAKSLEEERNLLKTQEKRSLEELMQDKENLRRQEAADIAGYATKSPTLLMSMAKARSAAVTRERELEKEIRAARNEREKAAINLTKAVETAKEKRSVGAAAEVEKKRTRLENVETKIAENLAELERIGIEQKGREKIVGMQTEGQMNAARLESALKMGLQERAGQIERDIKMGTADPVDQFGWRYIQLSRTKGEDKPETQAAWSKYIQAKTARQNAEGNPIDIPPAQGGKAPAASGSVRSKADAILAGG
jgi:hypothetical protein